MVVHHLPAQPAIRLPRIALKQAPTPHCPRVQLHETRGNGLLTIFSPIWESHAFSCRSALRSEPWVSDKSMHRNGLPVCKKQTKLPQRIVKSTLVRGRRIMICMLIRRYFWQHYYMYILVCKQPSRLLLKRFSGSSVWTCVAVIFCFLSTVRLTELSSSCALSPFSNIHQTEIIFFIYKKQLWPKRTVVWLWQLVIHKFCSQYRWERSQVTLRTWGSIWWSLSLGTVCWWVFSQIKFVAHNKWTCQ